VVLIEYHNTLYGDAARGCFHRSNGPDARKRTTYVIRQRLGVLINEGPRRNPWGYRGGACRSDPVHVSPPHGTRRTNGTYRVHIFRRRRYITWLPRRRPRRSLLPRRRPRRRSKKLLFNRFVSRYAPGFCGAPALFMRGNPDGFLSSRRRQSRPGLGPGKRRCSLSDEVTFFIWSC
jgi:hypothetical protein